MKKEGSKIGLEVYDPELLKRSLKNEDEFEEYCRDLAAIYGIEPEIVVYMVAMWLIGTTAKSEEEFVSKLSYLGIGVRKLPEDQ